MLSAAPNEISLRNSAGWKRKRGHLDITGATASKVATEPARVPSTSDHAPKCK